MIDISKVKRGSGFGIAFSDVLVQTVGIMMFLAVLFALVPHSNNKNKNDIELGQVCATISWPSRDIDIDLWGHAPGDPDTAGYTNMHSGHLNLFKDVTGFSGNPSHIMQEVMCSDSVIPGEYIFNIMYFSNHEAELASNYDPADPRKAVEVLMEITIQHGQNKVRNDVKRGRFTLTFEKQEKTMFRFRIGEDGNIIEESISSSPEVILSRGWRGG